MKKILMYLSIALLGAILMLSVLNINWYMEDYNELQHECNQLKADNLMLKKELQSKTDSIKTLCVKNDSLSITSIVMYNTIMSGDKGMLSTCIEYLNELTLNDKLPFYDYVRVNQVTYKYGDTKN